MKICIKCKLEKTEGDGNYSWCKKCVKEYDKERYFRNKEIYKKRSQEYRAKNRELLKAKRKKTTPLQNKISKLKAYNITIEDFNKLIDNQGNKCQICGRDFNDKIIPVVDHDHTCCNTPLRSCGKCIRGLLCHHCNRGIGFLLDDVDIVENAITYLRRYKK